MRLTATSEIGQRFRRCGLWGLLLAALILFVGCGGEGSKYAVRGKVTYQGQALPRGSVMFNPTDAALPSAVGRIESDGTYELKAAPGEYKVVVTATTEVDLSLETDDPAYKPPQSLIPENYSSPLDTPLQATVKAGANDIDLTL